MKEDTLAAWLISAVVIRNIAAIALEVLWFTTMWRWLGVVVGSFLAILLQPGVAIFPLVYWYIEGEVPPVLWVIWATLAITFVIIVATSAAEVNAESATAK